MLEKTTRVNLLYDFYGSLLTKKQQHFIELYFDHNLSLGEIADEYNISRQAVYDLIKRAVTILEKFEEKLQLYKKYRIQNKKFEKIISYLETSTNIEKVKIKNYIIELLEL
ncbi:MAG: hypothetical protein CVU88_07300 [Firmicutes bacterium HGW-Firmicutes-13]|nr:MAG: hypothetical protein CVU88_07300 [Firmicutes bacterium HGW-Firmicutes-13]